MRRKLKILDKSNHIRNIWFCQWKIMIFEARRGDKWRKIRKNQDIMKRQQKSGKFRKSEKNQKIEEILEIIGKSRNVG